MCCKAGLRPGDTGNFDSLASGPLPPGSSVPETSASHRNYTVLYAGMQGKFVRLSRKSGGGVIGDNQNPLTVDGRGIGLTESQRQA